MHQHTKITTDKKIYSAISSINNLDSVSITSIYLWDNKHKYFIIFTPDIQTPFFSRKPTTPYPHHLGFYKSFTILAAKHGFPKGQSQTKLHSGKSRRKTGEGLKSTFSLTLYVYIKISSCVLKSKSNRCVE